MQIYKSNSFNEDGHNNQHQHVNTKGMILAKRERLQSGGFKQNQSFSKTEIYTNKHRKHRKKIQAE